MSPFFFSEIETRCRCGCGMNIWPELLALLNRIREEYGRPINLTSAARCSTYNTKIGGARRSAHCEGIAADLVRTPELLDFLQGKLDHFNVWMEDPKYTLSWIHIDTRYRPVGRVFIP